MDQILSNMKYIGLGLYLMFILRFLFLSFKDISDLYLFEYKNFPEQWEEDGKPRGIQYWKFPKPSWKDLYRPAVFRSGAISPMVWVFVNPKWTEGSPEAQQYLKNLRKNILWWNIGCLTFFILVMLTLIR